MTTRFTHLQLHSEFSLMDSVIRLDDLIARARAVNMPAVAVTDRNNLFALVKFYGKAEKAGIKPIAGADVSVKHADGTRSQLTLLCRNRDGYLSLSRLLTRAWMEGHQTEGVAVDFDWIAQEAPRDLFALAGYDSAIGIRILAQRDALAKQEAEALLSIFGDRLSIAVTRAQRANDDAFNAAAFDLSSTLSIPLIASNDVRFLDASDYEAHEARVCISSSRVLDDPRRPKLYTQEQSFKSPEEMQALFADAPDAIDNANAIARACNLELQLGTYFLPAFPLPSEQTLESWMKSQAHEGLSNRLETLPVAAGHTRESYFERLDTELGVIANMGFAGYFLIVADFIGWAKRNGIPVGPGRGSGAGSLVAWALGITDLDPLPYDLLFERFLNPERVSMPDFDIDFCMDRRDEVIDYVAQKYGRDRVSQIITYGTMAAKAVVRDTGRVMGFGYGFVDGIAKLIPMTLGVGLEDALGRTEKAKKDANFFSPELRSRYEKEDGVRDLLDLALKLEDLPRNAGKHAGGVVIAPTPLSDFCPLFAEHAGDGLGRNPVTQFDKDDVEAVGLVKFDFLGLRTLTIIDWAVKAINARIRANDPDAPLVDIATLPLIDSQTFELFACGDTVAVFQFESRGMRELLKKAKPDTFEDLIALVSLYRPGPMDLIPDFIERKHGVTEVSYPHPLLEPVLAPTYGVVVYQEQVMQTAQVLAGYSLGGADLLRRAMGKKNFEGMAKERAKFEAGAKEVHDLAPAVAGSIFDLLEKFAGYGFNKSHAAAYALVSFQTAWLKAHYPAEFMAAVLSSDMDKTDKVVGFLNEARAMGLTLLPPDVNASRYMFEAIDPQTIRHGLGAVKGVGQNACEAISEARDAAGRFNDVMDFCARVDGSRVNRRALEALVHAGAMDGLGGNRPTLLLQFPEAMKAQEQEAKARAVGQDSLFGSAGAGAPPLHVNLPTANDWTLAQRLKAEKESLGLYLSGHPVDPYRDSIVSIIGHDLAHLESIWDNRSEQDRRGWRPETSAIVGGMITGLRRRGDTQTIVSMEDGKGQVECTFFQEELEQFGHLLAQDALLIIEGGLREDEFNGGFSLRARRVWNFPEIHSAYAERILVRLDARDNIAAERFMQALQAYRPGLTPLRIEVHREGVRGAVELRAPYGVLPDIELPGVLRAIEGVKSVAISFRKPW